MVEISDSGLEIDIGGLEFLRPRLKIQNSCNRCMAGDFHLATLKQECHKIVGPTLNYKNPCRYLGNMSSLLFLGKQSCNGFPERFLSAKIFEF